MKFGFPVLLLVLSLHTSAQLNQPPQTTTTGPVAPGLPGVSAVYSELPLGAIRPQGWLGEMLLRQKSGATGNLDQLYPQVMGPRNGWLGGDGDQWERGPYWLDGLLPLAYILHDSALIAKTKPWIEWALASQQPDGYFGPAKDFSPEPGLQRDNCRDWWPKMVMLKILKQYYSATGDKRVINMMTRYFRYQLRELPLTPLDHWSFWGRYRAGDNLMVVYWLYNITGDSFLLELGDLLHSQTFDYTEAFLHTNMLSETGSIHAVNLAQGLKEPLVYYQHHPEKKYLEATQKGLADLRLHDGFANGLFGGDESLHGNNPTQGSELCTAVEMMFSLETILSITGNVSYADQLEKIAFNALPAQTTEDYLNRQYFQQANQVMVSRHMRNFDINHGGTDLCYGLLTGYPCCTANMHQGWPKFTQNLFYRTSDQGLAAMLYAPCEMKATVMGGKEVSIREQTNYPFEETIRFTISTPGNNRPLSFPFHLRIPPWCKKATIQINGSVFLDSCPGNQVVRINRAWKSGDVVALTLPMPIFRNRWYENAVSVERGPLTYSLKIGAASREVPNQKDPLLYGRSYYEISPTTPWNYGLTEVDDSAVESLFRFEKKPMAGSYPWNEENAPVMIRTRARRIPSWGLYNDMTGPLPRSNIYQMEADSLQEEIILIPYGCTRLRITEFPVIDPPHP